MEIKKIMVIGAGQMGAGIAQVSAAAGIEVILNDIKIEFAQKGLNFIEKTLSKNVQKGKIDETKKSEILSKITLSENFNDASDCDLVIEAIVENMKVKTEVFSKLDEICKAEAILASNTSSLPITEIATSTTRPDKIIGMHFMNPVPVMTLVELIRGLATSDETYDTIKSLCDTLGKFAVEVRDVPAFALNRILISMINEAIYCVYEGVSSPSDIDEIMKRGANHPMGPLQLADFIGLDTCLAIMETMYVGYSDSKYRPCPLLRQYVKAGWLGRKSGKGFYEYNN